MHKNFGEIMKKGFFLTQISFFPQALHSFFRSLIPKEGESGDGSAANMVTVWLKNDMKLEGCLLVSIDANMNM